MKFSAQEITRVGVFAALHVAATLVLRFGGEAMVPFSLVPFMAFLAAFALGGKLGAMSLAVYMLLGLLGVPVFARPPYGGLVYVLQPTFGFIIGFIAAAFVAGRFDIDTPLGGALAIVTGLLALYAVGLPYLWGIVRFYMGRPVDFWWAIRVAALPFIGLDIVKAVLALLIGRQIRRGLHRA
ncbi:MAG: Biotin transporter BioY [Firmicutes bacterium]|nr:Biotin transporter BioY [candidate division NPL-UPA2 bacterium]